MIQRYRFQPPSRTRRGETTRSEIVSPIGGLDQSTPPWNLRGGRTPYAENVRLTRDRLGIEKRPGMQQFYTGLPQSMTEAKTPVAAFVGFSTDGRVEIPIALSSISSAFYYRNPNTGNWLGATGTNISSRTADIRFATVFRASDGSVYNFWTNDDQMAPQSFIYNPDLGIAALGSGSGSFLSSESQAKYVAAFNERLLYFNTSINSATRFPTRVRWSIKGDPFDFISYGAGFQDLAEMHGEGRGMLAERDRLLLWSEHDVWMGRARNDDFGFDFFALNHEVGLEYPKTLSATDVGPIWVGKDLRMWRLVGNEVQEIGREVRSFLRSNLSSLDNFYATFDRRSRQYRLYFLNKEGTLSLTSNPANAALILHTDTLQASGQGSWFYYKYPYRIPAATEHFIVSSAMTPYVESEGVFTDQIPAGQQTFTAKWRSQAIRSRDANAKEAIAEAWIDGRGALASVAAKEASSNATLYTSPTRSFGTTSVDTTLYFPLSPVASRHPQIEIISTDGTSMQIHSIRLTLRAYSGRF